MKALSAATYVRPQPLTHPACSRTIRLDQAGNAATPIQMDDRHAVPHALMWRRPRDNADAERIGLVAIHCRLEVIEASNGIDGNPSSSRAITGLRDAGG